jgi:hypothetical protein
MGYDNYYQPQGMAQPEDAGLPFDLPDDAKGAAFSVAFILIAGTLVLTFLKRSGFRAMIAVGRS